MKVGDRVRVIDEAAHAFIMDGDGETTRAIVVGDVVTIEQLGENNFWYYSGDFLRQILPLNQVELEEEPFQVGDKVRLIHNGRKGDSGVQSYTSDDGWNERCLEIGEIVTVTEVLPNSKQIQYQFKSKEGTRLQQIGYAQVEPVRGHMLSGDFEGWEEL